MIRSGKKWVFRAVDGTSGEKKSWAQPGAAIIGD